MRPIASRVLLFFALISCGATRLLADDNSTAPQTSAATALPDFIPATGRTNYAKAVNDNSPTAVSARQAAEALSAKFSGITTSSIGKDDLPATPPAKPRVAVAETGDARSIVLAANQPDDPKSAKIATPQHRSKPDAASHRIPRDSLRKKAGAAGSGASSESLASIGQKVSFLDLLTIHALCK